MLLFNFACTFLLSPYQHCANMHLIHEYVVDNLTVVSVIVFCFCFSIQPKIAEENLTYAELELIKPHRAAKGVPSNTVYAQILFEENQL